LIITNVRR